MDQARFARVQQLFAAAMSLPPTQWPQFLRQRTNDDPSLADEVLDLLQRQARGTGDLAAVVQEGAANDPLPPGTVLGPYQIQRRIAAGGMGAVYAAVQSDPIERAVAIKVMKVELRSPELVQRFEWECRALARMDHPCIAKVHECRTTPDGHPYMVMELVSGVAMTTYCDRVSLSLGNRVRLVRRICEAIQHAHAKQVVHRDLKPDNVLVSDSDKRLQLKVVDFGLALATGGVRGAFRGEERGAGTPIYMAPEQAADSPDELDTRVDVYAIGVILYEMLVGSLPLPASVVFRDGPSGIGRALREVQPEPPSTRLAATDDGGAAIAKRRRCQPAALAAALRDDFDHIVAKALAKRPDDRYATPADLGADLQRFLDGEPVLAAPRSKGYTLRKLVRRHRGRIAATAAVLLVALAGGIGITWNAVALSRTMAEYQQLEGVVTLRNLARELEALPADSRGRPAPAAAWIEAAQRILARRGDYEAARRHLTSLATPAPVDSPGGAPGAQSFPLAELEGLLAGLDRLPPTVNEVARRLRFAEQVRAATFERSSGPTWADVRADLATSSRLPRTFTIRDEDVCGLVPIGKNPASGLWEFYDLRSAWDGASEPGSIPVPSHDARGDIVVNDGTGIVFVLLPGGRHRVAEPLGQFVDAREKAAAKRQVVELAPFFMARHELTRGQWRRLGGDSSRFWHPSSLNGEIYGDRHPAEAISWDDAVRVAERHELTLPTEVQWEYACRAGTATTWWFGDDVADIAGRANLVGTRGADVFSRIGRVGALSANDFGLHDMHGNVAEWCLDWFESYAEAPEAGHGLRGPDASVAERATKPNPFRVIRGGSFQDDDATTAASSHRDCNYPTTRTASLGVRFVRRLRGGARS